MKHLSNSECDALLQQSGFTLQRGITEEKAVSTTQMLSLKELHTLVRHVFIVGQEHAKHKNHKK
jgi:hypothetical protein